MTARVKVTSIDAYLAAAEPAKREALERIRRLAKKIVPEADETIRYGMPTLTYRGKPFLGFAAHQKHIGVYPYSGRVIGTLADALRGYATSKGAIRVPLEKPLPERTLRALIARRLVAIRDDDAGRGS